MRRAILAGCILAGTFVVGVADAETTPDNAIKYRQAVLQTLGAGLTGVSMNLKGEVTIPDAIPEHAAAVAAAAPLIAPAFEQDTAGQGSARTKAKSDIWASWDDFQQLAGDTEEAAMALADVAATGDNRAIGQQLQTLGASCKACHDKYRD